MSDTEDVRTVRTRTSRSRKINPAKVQALRAKGFNTVQIAKDQGVNHSTISRFLQRLEPERQALEQFKCGRADVLARIQARSLDVQDRILQSLGDDVIESLKPGQKSSLLIALNMQAGTVYDKERLERGESTSNISLVSRMVDSSISSLYKRENTQTQELTQQDIKAGN